MHENKLTNINQEGLENELSFDGIDEKILIYTNFAKSRKPNGQAQSRRPDLSYGLNYSKKIDLNKFGPLNFNINYKYTGKFIDWDGSKNSSQKSTDLIDLTIKKNFYGNVISFDITNLLNERYEKPATYNQDGRQFKLRLSKTY